MYCTLLKFFILALSILLSAKLNLGAPANSINSQVKCEEQPRDLFLVVDDSASIGHKDIKKVRSFLSKLIENVHVSRDMTRVGFLQFSDEVSMRFNLDNNLSAEAIRLEFENMKYSAGPKTMTDLGLKMVAEEVFTKTGGDRPNVPDILVVFTDGKSRFKERTVARAQILKDMGVRIIAIGAGTETRNPEMLDELRAISSTVDDFKMVDFADLDSIVFDIVNKVCTLITTPKPPTPTTQKIVPKSRKPTARLRAPAPSLDLTSAPMGCAASPGKDILFVFDGTANFQHSYDLSERDFRKIKRFIRGVIKDLADERFRVGVMQYTDKDTATMEIDFMSPRDYKEIKLRLGLMVMQRGYKRYTGDALVKANHQFYDLDVSHQREENPNVVVLITRGDADDRERAISEAMMLESRNIRLITIGVEHGNEHLISFLNSLSDPKFTVLTKYKELKQRREQVLDTICMETEVIPKAGLPRESAECRRSPHDIFFLIDGSASIKYFNFEKVQIFLMDLVSLLRVEPSDINTGLMQFSKESETTMVWDLGKYSEFETITKLSKMKYQAGQRTATGDALTRVNKEVFTKKHGDRPGITDILILFTDGNAHDIELARQQADILKKEKGVLIVTIGAGTKRSLARFRQELIDLSSGPEYAMTVDFEELDVFAEKAFPLVCRSLKRRRL